MRSLCHGALFALAVLSAPATAAGAQGYLWTISNSTTDPYSNSGAIAPDPMSQFAGRLYLWLASSNGDSVLAAEFELVTGIPGVYPTGFVPTNGFLPVPTLPEMTLAFTCNTTAPYLAGYFAMGPDFGVPEVDLCLQPTTTNGYNITLDCGNVAHVNSVIGFGKPGPPSCSGPVGVRSETWGRLKAIYR